MFNKDSFLHYHGSNSRTGFTPSNTVYEGFVQDAEGKPWGWLKSLNLYEQQSTGIRMDPAEFQRYNIDILGYGSNDGDGGVTNVIVPRPTDWNDPTWVDGIFEYTGANKALNTQTIFDIVTNSTAYSVAGGPGDPELAVTLASTTRINLSEGSSGFYSPINPVPPFIALYISAPLGVAGWYIAEYTGLGYDYVRSVNGTSFPDPITTTLTSPLAITFYATDPGSPAGWSDYTTP